ncbi:unnamed protein product [Cladocopium goreaui]|uniref:Uncharacterized protein n=1 Tax=Cladocopium goreaui TaxID=2562237 RepID=A0A9P1GPE6_9DINO|nr:unnamed protein product [Cladocopium goreaui]
MEMASELSQRSKKTIFGMIAVAKGLHRSMQRVFGGSGLQLFVPENELKAGDDLTSAQLSPATVEERPLLTATADEEHLPFKALWSLLFNSKLRLYVEPEALHNMWNDLKNSYKRADLQPALLLGIVMSQSSHGPFGSGHHQWTKQQTAELLAESMTTSDFENIRESMTRDRYGDTTDIPESPSDLPDIPSVANFPIFAKQKSWFQAVVALYRLALDWSLDSVILGKAVELTKGLDSDDRMMDDGEDHEDAAGHGPADDHARPQTRKELDELKGTFSNKLVMTYHYHQDPMLPLEFKAMFWASRPLLHEYEATLDIQKDGQEKTLRWRAARAKGQTWWPTVVKTMCSINDPETMKMLHIPLTARENDFGLDVHKQILEKYSKLCIEISSARSWSQCQYTICVPNMFAIVHHESFEHRERGMNVLKRIWEAVLNAEKVLSHPDTRADVRASLKQVLDHMAWHKGQVARELFLVCQQGEWKAGDQQIRQLGFYLFGTPANTKHFLEDTFAHLADIVKRMVRNCKISKNLICSYKLSFSLPSAISCQCFFWFLPIPFIYFYGYYS